MMTGFTSRRLRRLSKDELIAPLFVREGDGIRREIPSMPGQSQHSVDTAIKRAGADLIITYFAEKLAG